MTATNLYVALDDARTWAAARSVTLSFQFTQKGELVLQGYVPPVTPDAQPETSQWLVSTEELQAGFNIDPVVKLGETSDPTKQLGASLRCILGGPLGFLRLGLTLADSNLDLTQQIIAKAAEVRAR